tara:strand:+ start:5325 stop:6263 length:939 start_codon:yes stop_codon:yes gene_type:complete
MNKIKRILILGGFGFIGSNIMKYIDDNLSNSYKVIVFDKLDHHPFKLNFNCIEKVYSGNFSETKCLEPIFEENEIDLVFHLISTTVPSNSSNIKYDIESNLVSTIDFLNLMIKSKVKDIVYLSSGGAIYGNSKKIKNELSFNSPMSSYGIIKLTIEKYLMMFSGQGLINPLILRLSNPYGPYHYSLKQGVLNVALRAAFEQKDFAVWGDGENTKDYIYVADFSEIVFKLLNLKINNQIINVGSGNLLSTNKILSHIKKIYSKFSWKNIKIKNNDVQNFELELTKLKDLIGDYSFTSIEEGVNKTNEWITKSR